MFISRTGHTTRIRERIRRRHEVVMITIILYYNYILYQYDINSDLNGFSTLVGAHTHVRAPTINVVYNN